MRNQFLRGLFHTFAYYLVGALLALLAHLFFEDTYTLNRGSRLYHLIITITWLGGCLWFLFGLYKYMRGVQKAYYLGVVSLNLLVITAVFIWVYQQQPHLEEALFYYSDRLNRV